MAKTKNNNLSLFQEEYIENSIEELVSDRFGKYAKYIIQDRALPDIRDGLKPVQRRVLFAANEMGIIHNTAYKKSARIVGEVIGKYHPHGDSSVYETMVRMSQYWKNNHILVDMHGNNGSIDGDSAAAMRYTETRLSKISNLLLRDLYKQTVPFVNNFDDSEKEPSVLPALFPNLLVNGATGIAAGYATNIAPHNLGEVIDGIIARIDSPNCRLETILNYIKGPDFPTGGIIQGKQNIVNAYLTGKEKIIIRSKFDIIDESKNKQIIISEIPYEVNKANLVRQIDEIRIDNKIPGIEEVRDESSKDGLRIVIDLKKESSIVSIKNYLLKNTSLQISYGINNIAIVNRKPILCSLIDFIDNFINYQDEILLKSTLYDLDKSKNKLEIIQGLIKAVKILDEVVSTIRRSVDKKDAKKNLESKYNFTPVQSEAIVQLRLYRLTSTDIEILRKEHDELVLKIDEYNRLVESKDRRSQHIKYQLREIKKEYSIPRKTIIQDEIEEIKVDAISTISQEPCYITVSKDGYIKSVSKKIKDSNQIESLGLKESDSLVNEIYCDSLSKIIVITSKGNFAVISAFKIKQSKWKDVGEHLNNFINLESDEKIIYSFSTSDFNKDYNLVSISSNGMIKNTSLKDLEVSRTSKTINLMKIDNDCTLTSCILILDKNQKDIIVFSKLGNYLRFDLEQVPLTGLKSKGVICMKVDKEDELISISCSDVDSEEYISIFTNLGAKRVAVKNFIKTSRALKAKSYMAQVKSNPIIAFSASLCSSNDIFYYQDNENNLIHEIKASDITISELDSRVSSILKQISFIIKKEKNEW
jgi:topoisomerase IV subunit A